MARKRKTSHIISILCRPGQSVKARVAGAGLRLGKLADASGMAQPTLHGYVSGKRRGVLGQLRIAVAFRKLSGQKISTADFWGDLWAEASMDKAAAG